MSVAMLTEMLPYFLAGMFGLAVHLAKTMASLHQGGDTHVTFNDYLRDHRFQTLLSIGMIIIGLASLQELNQLSMAAALGLGFASDSATDLVGGRIAKVYQ